MALPVSCAFRSNYNQKYLSYKRDQGEAYKHLQFTGNEIVSEFITTRFALERSTSNRELIHVRCCYSNKYWVRNNSTDRWIVASAKEPQDDTSLPSCTLFKPLFIQDDGTNNIVLRLLHVQTGFYASLRSVSGALDNGLYARSDDISSGDTFTIIDWDSLVIFPKLFRLKGDNGKYLTKKDQKDPSGVVQCLESSSDDPGEFGLRHKAIIKPDGTVHIQNLSGDPGFWTFLLGTIYLEGGYPPEFTPPAGALNTTFRAIKVADNAVAFLNLFFPRFCKREPSNNLLMCLADTMSMTRETIFEVEEALVSREVYNVAFRLEDSRIYDETPKSMASATAENHTSQAQTRTLTLSYKKTMTRRLERSMSFSLGFTIGFSTAVPLIGEEKIEMTGQLGAEYKWGEEQTEEEEFTDSNQLPIPPMTKTTWTQLATEGTCDVPFSYTVRDLYTDGQTSIYEMHDGLFRGVNSYNFYTATREEPLS